MEKLQELAECCICTEMFTDPRMLPCSHTFCLKCLQQTALNTEMKGGNTLPCPLCRRDFIVPVDGLAGLQKNFFMENLVKKAKISTPPEKHSLCEKCKADSENEAANVPVATNFCIECHQNICDRCSNDHMKHHVVPLGSEMKSELAKKFATRYCTLHEEKQIELYCADCRQVLCMMCFAESHKLHNCGDVNTVAAGFRKQIDAGLEKLIHFSEKSKAKAAQFKDEGAKFRQSLDKTEKAIIDRGRELIELVNRCTQSLLEELKTIKEKRSKEREYEREEGENIRIFIQSVETYCNELKSSGTACDICLSVHDLEARATVLQKMYEVNIKRPTSTLEVFFEALQLEGIIEPKNIVGTITVTSASEVDGANHSDHKDNISLSENNCQLGEKMQKLRPLPGFIETTTEPDMITLDDDPNTRRAKMSGINYKGHAAHITEDETRQSKKKKRENIYLQNEKIFQTCPICRSWFMRYRDDGHCDRCPTCSNMMRVRCSNERNSLLPYESCSIL